MTMDFMRELRALARLVRFHVDGGVRHADSCRQNSRLHVMPDGMAVNQRDVPVHLHVEISLDRPAIAARTDMMDALDARHGARDTLHGGSCLVAIRVRQTRVSRCARPHAG